MKKLLFFIISFIAISSSAQGLQYDVKNYGHGYSLKIIEPTIDNFILLCDMTESNFVYSLKSMGYFLNPDSSSPAPDYWNGSIDNFAYAKAINSFSRYPNGWIVYWGEKQYQYPSNSFSNFLSELSPYYYEQTDQIYPGRNSDVYKITRNGYVYGIFITNMGKAWDVHAYRFDN